MRVTAWALVVLLLIGQQIPLLAADYFGQVTFNGLPVPGATVTATQRDAKASATTDQDGIYHLTSLADGAWSVTIEMPGFASVTREITVPAEKEGPPSALRVPSLDEITAAAPSQTTAPLAFPRTSLKQFAPVVDERTGPESRPAIDLSVLIGPTGIGAEDGLLINGSMNNGASTPFALPRGIGNNRPRPPTAMSYTGGLQLGNSAWDARSFSLTGVNLPKPSYTDMQASGMMQGQVRIPWLRNAINVVLAYQGESGTNANVQSARLPTNLERLGDFSQTFDAHGQPIRLIDPLTHQPFDGNVIPADRISPQAASLLGLYPRADANATGRFNYQAPIVSATIQNGFRSRLTYSTFSQKTFGGGVSYQRTATDGTSLFGFEDSRQSSNFDAQAGVQLRPSRYMTVAARYQYSRTSNESLPFFANRIDVSGGAGIVGNDSDPRNWGPPSLTFDSDLASLTDGRYASSVEQTHLIGGEVSRFKGAHTFNVGGEMRARINDVFAQQDPRGTFGFTGAASGVDFADFLLGLPQTSSIAFGNPDKFFRGRSYAAFASDDWKVTRSLTLMLGVRWEYETPVREAQGRLVNLDVAPGFTTVSPVLGDTLLHADRSGIQPRLGVAWRPRLASSLVLRGGYGIYRNTNVYQSIATLLATQPPLSKAFNVATSPTSPLTLANGFVTGANGAFNTFAVDPDFKVSSAHTWDASMQRDIPGGLTLTATYVGIKGTHLMQQFLPNTYPAGAENPCPSCPTGFRYLASNGRSTRHSGQIQVRRRLSNGFTTAVDYTLAKSMDDAAAFGGATMDGGALVQNWLDPGAEYARSSFDQRHLVSGSVEYTSGSGMVGGTLLDGWKGRWLKDWTLAANVSTGSGLPLTPVYFAPVGGTGVIGSLRPDVTGVGGRPASGAYADAAAFAPPAPGQWGNAKRNSITGPTTFGLNASVSRTFRVGNRLSFDWRIDATNVLNRVTYTGVVTSVTSQQFGFPNRANDMRRLRSSIRVRF